MQANLRKVLVAVALITPAPSAFADVIGDWNEKAVVFVTPRMTPPAAQRVVAMVQVAMFDAVNSIERRYRPYAFALYIARSLPYNFATTPWPSRRRPTWPPRYILLNSQTTSDPGVIRRQFASIACKNVSVSSCRLSGAPSPCVQPHRRRHHSVAPAVR